MEKLGSGFEQKIARIKKERGIKDEEIPNFEHKTTISKEEYEQMKEKVLAEKALIEFEGIERKTINDYQPMSETQKKAKQTAVDYAMNPDGNIIFLGRPGVGKTHLAVGIAYKLIGDGKFVKYAQYNQMVEEFRLSQWDSINAIKTKNKYYSPRYLFIDDLFKASIKKDRYGGGEYIDYALFDRIFALINARYQKPEKCTIITCECSMDRLMKLDEAFASRLYEQCNGRVVEFADTDVNWRMK